MTHVSNRSGQKGAVIVTTALVLLLLLGFMGFAFDFGRLFVYKTELQTAMDGCALSAARELDGSSNYAAVQARAISAGRTVAGLHHVRFQAEAVDTTNTDITFADFLPGPYGATVGADTHYVRCQQAITGVSPWLLHALSAFSGNASYGQVRGVAAEAVATRTPAQTNCAIPVGICAKPGHTDSPWGFAPGEWIEGVASNNGGGTGRVTLAPGQFGWLDFPDSPGARGVKDALTDGGRCGLPGTDTEVEPGQKDGAEAAYNTRFGIYGGPYKNASPRPEADYTGFSWYFAGSAADVPAALRGRYFDTGPDGYQHHRDVGTAYNNLFTHNGNPSFATGHSNRRVVTAGIVTGCGGSSLDVIGFGCFLMLNPVGRVGSTDSKMWLEFIGDASAETGPCMTAGIPGGAAGVRVPALVQ